MAMDLLFGISPLPSLALTFIITLCPRLLKLCFVGKISCAVSNRASPSGKTTLLKRFADDSRKYVTLNDPDARVMAQKDPALFMQRYAPPVLIDEIQYAPQILPYIKMNVDADRKKGDFWLMGSQAFRMMKNVSESPVGIRSFC
jgi:hypothetical protein